MKRAAERLVHLRIQIAVSPSQGTFPAVEVRIWSPFLPQCLLVYPAAPPEIVEVGPREREEPDCTAPSPCSNSTGAWSSVRLPGRGRVILPWVRLAGWWVLLEAECVTRSCFVSRGS